ncbi:hypothetical protein PI124_g18765 [Phytophthora idaei]|nr:hypothetical protein PI126_g21344 [Phytophthora idaei]KAG3236222.1 hypothetical protein PI124_g18765 [Phytophthora idaei]
MESVGSHYGGTIQTISTSRFLTEQWWTLPLRQPVAGTSRYHGSRRIRDTQRGTSPTGDVPFRTADTSAASNSGERRVGVGRNGSIVGT